MKIKILMHLKTQKKKSLNNSIIICLEYFSHNIDLKNNATENLTTTKYSTTSKYYIWFVANQLKRRFFLKSVFLFLSTEETSETFDFA